MSKARDWGPDEDAIIAENVASKTDAEIAEILTGCSRPTNTYQVKRRREKLGLLKKRK